MTTENPAPAFTPGQEVVLTCWGYVGTHATIVGIYAMSNIGNEWVVSLDEATTMAVPADQIRPA